jgi:hypothetical protein
MIKNKNKDDCRRRSMPESLNHAENFALLDPVVILQPVGDSR